MENLKRQEAEGGLEGKAHSGKKSHKTGLGLDNLVSLAGSIALVGGAVAGAPIVAGLGLMGTAYSFIKKYYSPNAAH